MSDAPAPDPKPAEGEAPATPAPEAPPEQAPSEAPAQGEAPSTAPAEAEGQPPAASEAAAPEPAPEAEEPQPEPAPTPAPPQNYDGLESGLAWFGAAPSLPPVPVGYAPVAGAEAADKAPAAELSERELEVRRRRIKGTFESKRKEVETQKPLHRRIPLGALSLVPILVVLLVMTILYPPWKQGGVFTESNRSLDEALLTADPLPDQEKALSDLGIAEALPAGCWSVLPDGVLRMGGMNAPAKLAFALASDLKKFEIVCDVCVVDRNPNGWGVVILLDPAAGMQVMCHPKKPGLDYVAGRRVGGDLAGHEHHVTLKVWNEMKIVVDASGTQYAYNGKALTAIGGQPAMPAKVELTATGARILIRNWRVKPLD